LGFVNWEKLRYRFQFDDQLPLDDEIHDVTAVQSMTTVIQWQRHLPLERDALRVKFIDETCFIGGRKQSWSKVTMYFDRRADNATCQFFHSPAPRALRLCGEIFSAIRACGTNG